MVLLITQVRNVFLVLLLFCIIACVESKSVDFNLFGELNYVKAQHTPNYLTPEKCNRSHRTREICKLLSKSKKFKTVEKYLNIINYHQRLRQPHTAPNEITTTPPTTTTLATSSTSVVTNEMQIMVKAQQRSLQSFMDSEERLYRTTDRKFRDNNLLDDANNSIEEEAGSLEPEEEDFPAVKIFKYPSITKPKRKKSLRQLRPFKMKTFRSMVWPKVIKARNKLANAPLAEMIPFLWTIGISLILKKYIMKQKEVQILPQSQTLLPLLPNSTLLESEKFKQERNNTREKFQLAREVVSLTGESLNLAANQIDFLNVLAKTLQIKPLKPFNIGSFLASQRFNVNATLVNKMKDFRGNEGNMTSLVGEFVRVMAEQAIRNATEGMFLAG